MTTEPHPLRCDESCDFFTERVDDANKKYLYCHKSKSNIHYSWRMMAAVNGCASHSSAPTSAEQVLRYIESIINIYGTHGGGIYIDKYVSKKLAELRTQEQQRGRGQ